MVLFVAYDLHNHNRDYASVIQTIKSADGWCHPQGSVWLIDTLLTPLQWVNKLKAATHGDPDDEFFVVQTVKNAAWEKMDQEAINWINSPSRRW